MDLGKLNDDLLFDKGYLSDQHREEIDPSSPIILVHDFKGDLMKRSCRSQKPKY